MACRGSESKSVMGNTKMKPHDSDTPPRRKGKTKLLEHQLFCQGPKRCLVWKVTPPKVITSERWRTRCGRVGYGRGVSGGGDRGAGFDAKCGSQANKPKLVVGMIVILDKSDLRDHQWKNTNLRCKKLKCNRRKELEKTDG